MRLKGAEAVLAGATVDDSCSPRRRCRGRGGRVHRDVRGSAAYKRELLRVYVGRAVRQTLAGNGARR